MSQEETSEMLAVIDAANRVLLAAWKAHPPCRAKSWQHQAGLYVMPGYNAQKQWGSWAYVRSYFPDDGECLVVKMWAPTWREAIETALYEALTI